MAIKESLAETYNDLCSAYERVQKVDWLRCMLLEKIILSLKAK